MNSLVLREGTLRFAGGKIGQLAAIICWAIIGGLIGWQAWGQGEGTSTLLLVLGLPVAYGLAGSRWSAGALLLAYYLAGARGLPGGSAVFFRDTAPWWYGWALYGAACLLLAFPYVVLWSRNKVGRGWRFLAAVLVVTVPPFGLFGWCSPLAVGGVLFPGLSWVGLVLVGGLLSLLASLPSSVRRVFWSVGLVGIVSVSINFGWSEPLMPTGWRGVNTSFSRLASAGDGDAGQVLAAMKRVQWVKDFANSVADKESVVLPETVLGAFGGIAEFGLWPVEQRLAARGARILVGAELPMADGRYVNGLVVLGDGGIGKSGRVFVRQGMPVPFAMWMPWSKKEGAVGDLLGRGTVIELNNQRVAGLICYEQLLTWSILQRMVDNPSILLAASNVWWARGTSIPVIQKETVAAFARLFGVAVVGAVNG